MPTSPCGLCLEQRTQKLVQVAEDMVCEPCFKDYIVPRFRDGLVGENDFPIRWGTEVLDPADYLQFLPSGYMGKYSERERECKTPHNLRVYCNHQVKGQSTTQCGRFLGSRQAPTDSKPIFLCSACKERTCAMCTMPVQGIKYEHTCAQNEQGFAVDPLEGLTKGKDYQICPSCQLKVELRDGCNHVRCRCSAEFCFVCGVATSENTGHWSAGQPCPRYNTQGAANAQLVDDVDDFLDFEDDQERLMAHSREALFARFPALHRIYDNVLNYEDINNRISRETRTAVHVQNASFARTAHRLIDELADHGRTAWDPDALFLFFDSATRSMQQALRIFQRAVESLSRSELSDDLLETIVTISEIRDQVDSNIAETRQALTSPLTRLLPDGGVDTARLPQQYDTTVLRLLEVPLAYQRAMQDAAEAILTWEEVDLPLWRPGTAEQRSRIRAFAQRLLQRLHGYLFLPATTDLLFLEEVRPTAQSDADLEAEAENLPRWPSEDHTALISAYHFWQQHAAHAREAFDIRIHELKQGSRPGVLRR